MKNLKTFIFAGLWGMLFITIVYFIGIFISTFFKNPTKVIDITNFLCGVTYLATVMIYFEKKTTLMSKYNDSLELLYKHVGFTTDWVVYPVDDCTDTFWSTNEKTVKYAKNIIDFNSDGNYYEDEIYTQRFYKKHVYRGKNYTMIFCDPHVDGMRYFRIFDNKKEQKS
jgi:hypothetical protein